MLLTEQAAWLQGGDWAPFFAAECAKPYFAALDAFVTEAAAHTTVYPAAENIFAAFAACPAAGIRAVILGQDPYHEPGQALVVVWLEMLQRRGVTVFGGKGISVDHRVQLRQLHALEII